MKPKDEIGQDNPDIDIFTAVINELIKTMDNASGRIGHCLAQINNEQIWERPSANLNSIGIIIQHLCGNLRQWIVSGVGCESDIRNRPAEFTDEEKIGKQALMDKFEDVIQQCRHTLRQVTPEQLLQPRRIQGFEETVLSALLSSISHIELHGGQIVYITRMMLKDRYELRWKPATQE
jgi:hypothetical protein